jgi:hypothetical protein
MANFNFVSQATDYMISQWGMIGTVGDDIIASLVVNGFAYWRHNLSNGSHLALIRLFSLVVRREEVFSGNVLLNNFLSKVFIRAVEQKGLGNKAILAGDLDQLVLAKRLLEQALIYARYHAKTLG